MTNPPRVGTDHLDFNIRAARWDELQVDQEVAQGIVDLARRGTGTYESDWTQRITAREAQAIVRLAGRPAGSSGTVALSGSGIILSQADAAAIVNLARSGGGPRTFGSGGSVITNNEVQGVVAEARRGESTLGRVTQAEVDRVRNWRRTYGSSMTASARGTADAFVSTGANFNGRIDRSVSASRVVYPEYDRIFEDGVFDHMVVIGFDEHSSHVRQTSELMSKLHSRGFRTPDRLAPPLTDAEVDRIAALQPPIVARNEGETDASYRARVRQAMTDANNRTPPVVQYHVSRMTNQQTREPVIALQRVVLPITTSPGTTAATRQAQAKEAYIRRHMGHVDAFLYGGHARYGTGPDVDHIDSSAGNVHLANGYSTKPNAGPRDSVSFPRSRYQVLTFVGCTTLHYVPGLRSGNISDTRDVLVTNQLGLWSGIGGSVYNAIDGIMRQRSYNEIIPSLDSGISGLFEARYLRNNTFVPFPTQTLASRSELADVANGRAPSVGLRRGEFEHVRLIQQYLSITTPHLPPLALDGDPGPNTLARIQAFKRGHGIRPPDALVTTEFLQRLQQEVDRARAAAGGS